MDVAKTGPLEKGTKVRSRYDAVKEKPLDLSIQSRNLPFCGKSFYLDLPHNKGSQILTGAIKKLGGVIESFLSKEVTYVVSGSNEARPTVVAEHCADGKSSVVTTSGVNKAVKPIVLTKPTRSNPPVSSGLDEQRQPKVGINPKHISRGKELLQKAIRKKDGGTSILANARSWGVHILHVNEVLDYLEKLSVVLKSIPGPTKVEVVASPGSKTRKVAQLKSPFLKIEDQSRQFRPLHFHFQSFPQLNILAARGYSLFELTSPRSSYKDQPSKAKTVDAECFLTHSETEEKSPKRKPTFSAKKRRKGYCECCQEAFEELTTHLHSEQHLRFALDNSQYALVDHIISQFPNDFIVQAMDLSTSRSSAPNNVASTSLESSVPQLAEVKVFPDGLATARNYLKADDEERLISDFLKSIVTGVKSKDDVRVLSSAATRSTHPSLPARDLLYTMQQSDERKEMSFRALLETVDEHAGKEARDTRDTIISCSNEKGTKWLPDAHQYGKDDDAPLCGNGLAASAVPKTVAVLQAHSAMPKINLGKLQEGCIDLTASISELCEISSTRKRKRLGQQFHPGLKRRIVASGACYSEPVSPFCQKRPLALKIQPVVPGGCSSEPVSPSLRSSPATKSQILVPDGCSSGFVSPLCQQTSQTMKRQFVEPGICSSGPVSPSHHRDTDCLALVVRTKSEPIPIDTKGILECSAQSSVVQGIMEFPAAPRSVEALHALPRDLQHYKQLLGHWDCFTPSVDMPYGLNECKDDWDLNSLIPQGHKLEEKGLNLSCNIDSPTMNELSSTCCKHPTQGLSVVQQCMRQKDCTSTQSAFHVCPSGCSVSLVFRESAKQIINVGEANLSCFQIAHASTSGVTDGTSLPAVEMFSSASDWDVPLLSRLDSLHAVKTAPLDVDILRRTSVSMQDTGYESHLCSVLKPKSEFDWSFKEEGNRVNCWAEAECVPFTVLGTCLNSWAS